MSDVTNYEPHAGRHLLLDLYDCDVVNLDPETIRKSFEVICIEIGATVLHSYAHEFDNGGSSGVVVLAESHTSWHHWTDEKFIAIDLFVCGTCDPNKAIGKFVNLFKPNYTKSSFHLRGIGFTD